MSKFGTFLPVLALLFLSCTREEELGEIKSPPTPSLTSDSRWGVIRVPYAKILNVPDNAEAEVVGLLRKWDNVRLIARRFDNRNNRYWLEVEYPDSNISGWLQDFIVELFDSQIQAQTASREGLRK